jgi:hypothetical protein
LSATGTGAPVNLPLAATGSSTGTAMAR